MKGDVIIVEEYHKKAAQSIVTQIIKKIRSKTNPYCITVAGESGSGKSEIALAISKALENYNLKTIILGQDDYFYLPPKDNNARRRNDPEWLGPHKEVDFSRLQENINDALRGKDRFTKPLIDYDANSIEEEEINMAGIKGIIAEGTYTTLIKNTDTRIFIDRNYLDTFKYRKKRNRGGEVLDPFIEKTLTYEHKIIAGHKQLADFLITKDYEVIPIKGI